MTVDPILHDQFVLSQHAAARWEGGDVLINLNIWVQWRKITGRSRYKALLIEKREYSRKPRIVDRLLNVLIRPDEGHFKARM